MVWRSLWIVAWALATETASRLFERNWICFLNFALPLWRKPKGRALYGLVSDTNNSMAVVKLIILYIKLKQTDFLGEISSIHCDWKWRTNLPKMKCFVFAGENCVISPNYPSGEPTIVVDRSRAHGFCWSRTQPLSHNMNSTKIHFAILPEPRVFYQVNHSLTVSN